MKKLVSVFVALSLAVTCVFALAGCSKSDTKYDLVMITDGSPITDGNYNESAWNGVKSFGDENNVSYRYYQPGLNEDDQLDSEIINRYVDLAIDNGAKTIVFPGQVFADYICEVSDAHSDINFVLIDSRPVCSHNTHKNIASVTFDNLQAGYLAGYSAVAMGNTKLGFFGADDAVSGNYGSGYVQGAAKAADESATPVVLDYANFDDDNLSFDYSFTVKAVYTKIEDCKEDVFKVNVVNGYGTGAYTDGQNVTITAYPPEENKVFDHWEVKSDTDGVSDKKVNISSSKKDSMNLLVGDCDCTITAVYSDSETVPVTIKGGDTVNAQKDSTVWVTAPVADKGKVFDHWECDDANKIADVNSIGTEVTVESQPIELTPVYVDSQYPTFYVDVVDGTGSGSYIADDEVTVTANPPQDGYMFYKWENVDNHGKQTGIAMDNEYDYSTKFLMVDRYAAVVEEMIDNGTQVVFAGGNPMADSIFTANSNFDYPVYGFGYGYDQKDSNNCIASVVNDYGAAVKMVLSDYKAGNVVGDCSNGCIYVTNISSDKNDDNYNAGYAKVYKSLTDGKLVIKEPNQTEKALAVSKCLTVYYWTK